MSNEWKIVQGLKRQAQNDSFGSRGPYKETGIDTNYQRRGKRSYELTEKDIRDEMLRKIDSGITYHKDDKDANIELIRSYLQEVQVNGKVPNKFKIGKILINIDTKNPKRITFSSIGKILDNTIGTLEKYPYTVAIDEDDIYSEVDIIDYYFKCGLTAVYEGEGKYVPIRMTQKVSVINAEEISESFDILSRKKGISIQPVIEGIIRNNPEYKIGNRAQIYREEIDPEEKIRKFQSEREEEIYPKTKLPTDLATIYETRDDYHENHYARMKGKTFDTYGEGIPVAKEIEEHCKYIYSLFIEAEKGILKQTTSNKSKTSNQDTIQNDTTKSQESPTMNYDTDVESLSEEELDALIEKMENLQREKQSKIERLQKIKKAQDLIALSKEQDKIIADLESQIEIEGVDFGEK